tara:strand:- start:645 stop:830 length:186 start_codon:yes stop_codon:yes gene_type:complete
MSLSGSEPFPELAIEMEKIPVEVALEINRSIPEAVNLMKLKLIIFDMTGNGSSARGAEIDG